MANLYENIRSLCEERGIKGGKMCTDIGVSKSLMTDLKAGRKKDITAETAKKIANYFGVSVGYLLGTEPDSSQPDHDILDDVDFAFYDGYRKLTEHDKEVLRQMVRVMRDRNNQE